MFECAVHTTHHQMKQYESFFVLGPEEQHSLVDIVPSSHDRTHSYIIMEYLSNHIAACRFTSLEAAQICDVLKGKQIVRQCDGVMLPCVVALIVVVCVIAMTNVDTSVAYHMVRGQSFIKLYVIINVLEVSVCMCMYVCVCVCVCLSVCLYVCP